MQDAEALLDMAKLDDKGTVRGVTVEQARAALKTAWIGLGLNILLAGAGIATLFGRLILKGRGAAKIPGQFTRLSALAEVNPAAAEKMIAKIKDMAKVESLLEITGDSLLLEKLLDKTHNIGDLEFVLLHGDPRKMMELVDLAGDSTKLTRVLENSPSVATAETLLKMTDDADGLAVLLKTADNSTIATELLQWTKDPGLANTMLSVAGDQHGLVNLSKTGISPQVAADSLAQVENAEELANLARRMDSGPDQVGKLLQGRTGKELNELLDSGLKPNQIEVGVGTPRVGPQPTFASNAVPVTPEVKNILARYGVQDEALLQQMEPHELRRIKTVFGGSPRIPKSTIPIIQQKGIRWALDGVKSPGNFADRWEYFQRVAFKEARADVAAAHQPLPRGKGLDVVAAEYLAEPAQWAKMTARLQAREEAVQKLAGIGWVDIGEHAGVDAVKANASRLTFGNDTAAAYHVADHYKELAPAEAAAAGASAVSDRACRRCHRMETAPRVTRGGASPSAAASAGPRPRASSRLGRPHAHRCAVRRRPPRTRQRAVRQIGLSGTQRNRYVGSASSRRLP